VRVAIVGLGRVGKSMALYLSRRGEEFLGGYCSREESTRRALEIIGGGRALSRKEIARAELVLISTPDSEVEREAGRIAEENPVLEGKTFLHLSGSLPMDVLEPLRTRGAEVGVLHPLFPFFDLEFSLKNLEGSYAGVEGGEFVKEIARRWGFSPFPLPSFRVLYHAGAVLSAGLLAGYISYPLKIAQELGIPPEAYLRLASLVLKAVGEKGLSAAVTGPWSRGDFATVERHLSAIREERKIYELLLSRLQEILSG